nr:hypothetical protein [Tanacetum cinerariifolium]
MENEHELSYETLTRVYLGSYEHYKSVRVGLEPLEPGFEFDDQEWVEIKTPGLQGFILSLDYCSWDFLGSFRIFFEERIAAIKGYRGGSGG